MARRGTSLTLQLARAALIGGVVTLIVAWCCAAMRPADGWPGVFGSDWEDRDITPQHRDLSGGRLVVVSVRGDAWHTKVARQDVANTVESSQVPTLLEAYPFPAGFAADGAPIAQAIPRAPPWAAGADDPSATYTRTAAWGWPFRCLFGTERTLLPETGDGLAHGPRIITESYLIVPGDPATSHIRRLPLRPIWTGLIINTAFYGTAYIAMNCAFVLVVRSVRRHRGRCVFCGYVLRGLPLGCVCPECGTSRPRNANPD